MNYDFYEDEIELIIYDQQGNIVRQEYFDVVIAVLKKEENENQIYYG